MSLKKILHVNIKDFVIPALLSTVLLIATYFANNMPVFTGENLNQFFLTQWLCDSLGVSRVSDYDDSFFVNVSYDNDFAKVLNYSGDTLGNTEITDRNKLYHFLRILKNKDEYKYIILDIMFDPNDKSKADSLLYPMIESMRDIVVIRDDSIHAPCSSLINKSALANYFATITATNFVRYQYLSKEDVPYIPLKVYEDLSNVQFKRRGFSWLPIYTCDERLCYNSCFVAFDSKQFSIFSQKNKTYPNDELYNLGSDLLCNSLRGYDSDEAREERIHKLSKNKYIFIGNYTDDLHDTYMGVRPGPFILYRALKTLEEEKHIVTFFKEFYWFVIFAMIFWLIIGNKRTSSIIPRTIRSSNLGRRIAKAKMLRFCIASIGYTSLLFLFSTIEYVLTNSISSIALPCYVFMLTKFFYDYKRF